MGSGRGRVSGLDARAAVHRAAAARAATLVNAPPATYAEWVDLLHRFERPDEDAEVLAALARAKFSLSSEMAQRLCKRIIEVFEARVRTVAANLQREFSRGIDEVAYGHSMARVRHELAPIGAFCNAACWPAEFSTMLKKSLDDFVAKTQEKLEEDATTYARHDQGARLSMIRKFPLSIGGPAPEPPKGFWPNKKPASDAPLPTRRIIL
jgi:hypothetical protein